MQRVREIPAWSCVWRNEAAYEYTIEAAHNPEVAGSNPASTSKGPGMAFLLHPRSADVASASSIAACSGSSRPSRKPCSRYASACAKTRAAYCSRLSPSHAPRGCRVPLPPLDGAPEAACLVRLRCPRRRMRGGECVHSQLPIADPLAESESLPGACSRPWAGCVPVPARRGWRARLLATT